jgi:alkylation response protein AidB-like acyl-CoA dehydrogenase
MHMRDLNVSLDDQVGQLRERLRAWLPLNAPAHPAGDDETGLLAYRRAWHECLVAGGWSGAGWPVEFGGQEPMAVGRFACREELSRAGVPRLLTTPGLALVGPMLTRHGTPSQQASYLPRILSAEDVWCLGLSEPGAGSDLAGLSASARLDGQNWVVTGCKTWVRWAAQSTHCALMVRTDPAPPGKRHRGLSFVVIELDRPGVDVRGLLTADGRHTYDEIRLTQVIAGPDALIGPRGGGWRIAMELMELERADQSFTDHVSLLGLLADIAAMAAHDPRSGLRGRLVAVWTQCQLLRAANLHTARQLDRGEAIGARGSVIKLFWTQVYQDLAAVADIASADRLVDANEWSRRYLDARAASIYSGTSEIQRNIVGEQLAGLPRR